MGDLVEAPQEIVDAPAPDRGGGGDRDAELPRQRRHVDIETPPRGDVDHVEHEQDRLAEALEFDRQSEREPEIGRVGHAQQQVGPRFLGHPAEDEVAGHLLVGAARPQGVGSGQDRRD